MMYNETLKTRYCFIGNVMMFCQPKSVEIPSISLTLRSKKNVNIEIIQWFGFVSNIWSLMLVNVFGHTLIEMLYVKLFITI